MKKLLFLVVLSTMIIVVGCTKSQTDAPSDNGANMQSFTASGFSIQYPEGRNYQEKVYGSEVMFFSPQLSGDQFRENVGVISELLPSDMSVSDYYATIQQQLPALITNYQELNSQEVTISGVPAKKVTYIGTQGSYALQRMQAVLIQDKLAYILTYTASEGTFDEFSKEAEAMFASFQLK